DLAQAMVYCARTAMTLTAEAPGRSVVLHAPTDTAHSMRALAARTAEHAGVRERRVIAVPRRLTALLGRVNTLMRELSGIADLWYAPCVLEPGVRLPVHGLQANPWTEAIASPIAPPPRAAHGSAAAEPRDARGRAWRRGRGSSRPGPLVTSDNSLPRGGRLRLSWPPTPPPGAPSGRAVPDRRAAP